MKNKLSITFENGKYVVNRYIDGVETHWFSVNRIIAGNILRKLYDKKAIEDVFLLWESHRRDTGLSDCNAISIHEGDDVVVAGQVCTVAWSRVHAGFILKNQAGQIAPIRRISKTPLSTTVLSDVEIINR